MISNSDICEIATRLCISRWQSWADKADACSVRSGESIWQRKERIFLISLCMTMNYIVSGTHIRKNTFVEL